MSLWRLVTREILFRKLSFALAVLSVLAAVGCLVAELTLLRRHDLQTAHLVAQKEAETAQRMDEVESATRERMAAFERETAERMKQMQDETAAHMKKRENETAAHMKKLEDDYRKIALKLGFNVLILPKDQNLSDLYADDFASKYMPEEYAERLGKSGIASINHLLPSLHQKLKWPEQERTVILVGVRGEVPILNRADDKKPLLQPVPTGTMVLGHELHRNLKLKPGDKVKLLGKEFAVHQVHPERGNKDDITVWINLKEAQHLLNRAGQINAILALECDCSADRLERIREDIAAILPDTQVIEFASQALTRAEARNRAAAEAKESLSREVRRSKETLEQAKAQADAARQQAAAVAQQERDETATWAADVVRAEKTSRARLRQEQEAFAGLLIPLVLAGAIVWLGVLAFNNVRERRTEIGILRALGLGSGHVFTLFLGKALLVGLLGAALGYVVGTVVGALGSDAPPAPFDVVLLLGVLLAAPALCCLASGLPALLATKQDPAVVLREE